MGAKRDRERIIGHLARMTGEVQVVPDMARLTLEVRREGADPAALKRELDTVTEISKVLGFYDEDSADRRSSPEAALEALATFKGGFNDMGSTVTTFHQAAERAVPEYRAKVVQIQELNSRITDLQAQVASKTTQMNSLGSEKDTIIADLLA